MNVVLRLHTMDPGPNFDVGLVPGSERSGWLVRDDVADCSRIRSADGTLIDLPTSQVTVIPGEDKWDWGAVRVPKGQPPSRPWVSVRRADDDAPILAIEIQSSALEDGGGVTILGEIRGVVP